MTTEETRGPEILRAIAGEMALDNDDRWALLDCAASMENLQSLAKRSELALSQLTRLYWEMRDVMRKQGGELKSPRAPERDDKEIRVLNDCKEVPMMECELGDVFFTPFPFTGKILDSGGFDTFDLRDTEKRQEFLDSHPIAAEGKGEVISFGQFLGELHAATPRPKPTRPENENINPPFDWRKAWIVVACVAATITACVVIGGMP